MQKQHRPVFVDNTGRRRRQARVVGISVAGVLISFLLLVGAGVFAGSPLGAPTWPGRPGHPAATRAGAAPSDRPAAATSPLAALSHPPSPARALLTSPSPSPSKLRPSQATTTRKSSRGPTTHPTH